MTKIGDKAAWHRKAFWRGHLDQSMISYPSIVCRSPQPQKDIVLHESRLICRAAQSKPCPPVYSLPKRVSTRGVAKYSRRTYMKALLRWLTNPPLDGPAAT